MPTIVGLDCGGSTSRVLAIDGSGAEIFQGLGGPANLLATPPPTLERSLREATAGCPSATTVCGAFAGLVGATERERAIRLLGALFPGASLRAEADYVAAHAAAPAGTDITVIAGTGSLVCGRDAAGKVVKSGGGGYLLGDEGSGFRYGRAALAHFVGHPEVRSEGLGEAVMQAFGTDDPARAVAILYAAPSPQSLLAGLLPAFATDLDAGRDYAEAAAARETDDLAAVVARHAENHVFDRPALRIALAGGVWHATDRFERLFRLALQGRLPDRRIEVERTVRPPVQGAVALAKEQPIGN